MAQNYLTALRTGQQFSDGFAVCVDALAAHLEIAKLQIARLA
jgi:hypothetical protein